MAASRRQSTIDFIFIMLHATGGHKDTIWMRLVASRMNYLHAQAASIVQSRQFFESTLPEQLFELKNEETVKKSEILHDICSS